MPLMPDSDPVKASLERKIHALERELRALQRSAPVNENVSLRHHEVVFSYPSAVYANDPSGEYVLKATNGAIQRVDVTAISAGNTQSVLSVRVNGTEKYALTIPAGTTMVCEDGIYVEFSEYDTLSLNFTSAGTNLADVVVTVQFSEAT